jgi:hypothetical protein
LAEGTCDYKELACAIDHAGWQQFSFIKQADHSSILGGREHDPAISRWLVISHSCDLVHHTEQEPYVELLALEQLQAVPDAELAKQSPRMQILTAYEAVDQTPVFFRARACYRTSVPRERFRDVLPDTALSLRSASDPQGIRGESEHNLAQWLAGRYNRIWTPSEFDRRLAKNVGKIQSSLERLQSHGVEEVFARITPSEELAQSDGYEICLIIVVDPLRQDKLDAVRSESRVLARWIAEGNGIAVLPAAPQIELSDQLPYGAVRGWFRFHEVFRDSLASRAGSARRDPVGVAAQAAQARGAPAAQHAQAESSEGKPPSTDKTA